MGLFSKKKSENGLIGRYNLKYMNGLDIPENISCEAHLYNDKLILKVSSNEYELNLQKINAVDYSFNLDEKKYKKSSISKGIIGAATFGVAGAVIGSAPKTKTERKVSGSLVISYISNEKENFIILRDSIENSHNAAKLYDKIKPLIEEKEKTYIEL